MALVKFGAGVSEMRGKEGGVIYSRNAFGSYIKTKVSPVNPNTGHQQDQRGLMGNLAQAWATLTAQNKADWDNLGAQCTRVNRFGDNTTYTGFSLFMRLNRNLSICGEALNSTPPTIPTMPTLAITTFTADASSQSVELGFTPTPVGAAIYLLVYLTPNILTGRRYVKNYYRLVKVGLNAASAPLAMGGDWMSYFTSSPVEDAKIYVKAKLVDQATGFDTVPVVSSCVVAA